MSKSTIIYGVGINDADYRVQINNRINGKQKLLWVCPYFSRWQAMLWRCYSKKQNKRCPTYKDCFVCDEWLTFSVFKEWMTNQDWEGKQLDKDIISHRNKVYCPEYCAFVTHTVNSFCRGERARPENLLPGVQKIKKSLSFYAYCKNPITKTKAYIGAYETEVEAHEAWLSKKHEYALVLAETESDERVSSALRAKYLDRNLFRD